METLASIPPIALLSDKNGTSIGANGNSVSGTNNLRRTVERKFFRMSHGGGGGGRMQELTANDSWPGIQPSCTFYQIFLFPEQDFQHSSSNDIVASTLASHANDQGSNLVRSR